MSPAATVALVFCESYEDEAAVLAAVARGFDLLGGAGRFFQPGEQIVLKPNMLSPDTPDKNVSPHPAVFRGVIKALQAAGVQLTYGDSPGFGKPSAVARRMGLSRVADECGVPLADFEEAETVSFPEGHFVKQFDIAKGVLAADGLVSVAKFKTHGMMRITGAIKNQFGCVPGARKAGFHARMSDEDKFARMLVDLNLLLKPRFCVMDGIVAMQGNGPRNGDPYPLKALLFSNDMAALDATMARIIQLDPRLSSVFRYAQEWGLGETQDIEYVGEPLERFIVNPAEFKANREPAPTTVVGGFLETFLKQYVVARPYIEEDKCVRCGNCVHACPSTPKAVNWHDGDRTKAPSYHYEDCIRCYCCQELCPFDAVQVETPPLGKFLNRLRL
ncbi:MAG: DUF362 domain-containing protein [Anaerolineae bacterium]|nr:DUF362 domain-containing protein [Anaerolineae bacterium]